MGCNAVKSVAWHLLCRWYLARLIRPWRWMRYVPPKRRLTFNGLHGVISHRCENFKILHCPVKVHRRFRRTYCFHHQGQRVSQARTRLQPAFFCFLEWLTLRPRRWRQYVSLKRRTRLYGVRTKKIILSIVTAVRTSNPKLFNLFGVGLFMAVR
jgi:hypothetical protein